MIYLASPYWVSSPVERHLNFKVACRATLKLMRAGQVVFSPAVYGHALIMFYAPGDNEFWQMQALSYLEHCTEVVVLTIGNWQNNLAVAAELRRARELGMPIRQMSPDDAHVGHTTRAAAVPDHLGQSRSEAFYGPRGEPQPEPE